jgi:hypothetical protein
VVFGFFDRPWRSFELVRRRRRRACGPRGILAISELPAGLIAGESLGFEEEVRRRNGPPHPKLSDKAVQSRFVEIKDIGPGPVKRKALTRRNVSAFAQLVQLIKSIWWIRDANAKV